MALVLKILQVLAMVFAAVLLAGAYDVFHFGLHDMIAPFAIGPIVLFMIFSIIPVFLTVKPVTPATEADEEIGEKMAEIQAKVNSRLTAIQSKMDDMTGQGKESLEEENRQLKEQLDAIHQAEREKVMNDARSLRERNQELENQIKQWAIDAVGKHVTGEQAEEADPTQASTAA